MRVHRRPLEAMGGHERHTGSQGRSWKAMGGHGAMRGHGRPWESMGVHGSPWESMGGGDGHKQTEILVVETIGGEGCN
jgi:hypothetical protein